VIHVEVVMNVDERISTSSEGGDAVKKPKKLTLSKETLRTLDERDLSLVVGGDSGNNEPPHGGPNSCPNTKDPGCK
jgi:hypothetical protein